MVCTLLHRFSEMHKVVPFILDPHQSRKQIHCCKICCNTSSENCAKGAFKLKTFRTLRNIKETRNAFHPKTITHLILKTISCKRFVIQDSTFPGKVVFISPFMWWTCECDNCKNSTRWGRRRLSGGFTFLGYCILLHLCSLNNVVPHRGHNPQRPRGRAGATAAKSQKNNGRHFTPCEPAEKFLEWRWLYRGAIRLHNERAS